MNGFRLMHDLAQSDVLLKFSFDLVRVLGVEEDKAAQVLQAFGVDTGEAYRDSSITYPDDLALGLDTKLSLAPIEKERHLHGIANGHGLAGLDGDSFEAKVAGASLDQYPAAEPQFRTNLNAAAGEFALICILGHAQISSWPASCPGIHEAGSVLPQLFTRPPVHRCNFIVSHYRRFVSLVKEK
jgi:hypothetical protein